MMYFGLDSFDLEARKNMIDEMKIPERKGYKCKCVLPGCREALKKSTIYSSHKILPKWFPIVRSVLDDPNWTPTENSRICNLHFDDCDVRKSYNSNRLNYNAVPKHYLEPKPLEIIIYNNKSQIQTPSEPTVDDTTTPPPLNTSTTFTTDRNMSLHYRKVKMFNTPKAADTTTTTIPSNELTSIPFTVDATDFIDIADNLESTNETSPTTITINEPKSSIKTSTKTASRSPMMKIRENSKTSTASSVSQLNKHRDNSKHSSLTVQKPVAKNKDVYQELEDYKILVAQTLIRLKLKNRRIECLEKMNRKLKLKVITKSATIIRPQRRKRSRKVGKKINQS